MNERHRLIPTLGTGISWCVDGYEQARASAERAYRETEIPILIVRAPPDKVVEQVEIVGGESRRRR